MKYLVVLSFDLKGPDELDEILRGLNFPELKGISATARLATDPLATQVEELLDNDG